MTDTKENKQQNDDLQLILSKLDSIGDTVYGRVEEMLNTFEAKMFSKMDQHLAKYEKQLSETTQEFADQIKRHDDIIRKHSVDIHTIDGKTEAARKRMTEIEAKVDGVHCKLPDVRPKRVIPIKTLLVAGGIGVAVLGINVAIILYMGQKIISLLVK